MKEGDIPQCLGRMFLERWGRVDPQKKGKGYAAVHNIRRLSQKVEKNTKLMFGYQISWILDAKKTRRQSKGVYHK